MAKLPQTLIPILLLLAAAATTARSQSTTFTYDFWGGQPTDLTYQGSAHFPSDSATTFLRLTDAQPAQVGRVLYWQPIQFWQTGGQVDFETTINFIITPNAASAAADGLAFFIAPVGSTIPAGSSGANLGVFGSHGNGERATFAVEFDTYANSAWDPSYVHIGIDIDSPVSRNTTNVGSAIIGRQVTAKISYVAALKKIVATASAAGQTFEVSYDFDLSALLHQQVQVGISASTGQYVATHDIVSWYFTATMVNNGAAGVNSKKHLGNVIQQFV